jgi:hypothetical protein
MKSLLLKVPSVLLASFLLLGVAVNASVPTLLMSLLLLKSLLQKVTAVVLAYLLLLWISAIASVPTLRFPCCC